jgi:hypothetical protein
MRVIIACAGRVPDDKWGDHLGVPKHLAPVGGEPLLHRTVRQALAHTGEVFITAPVDDPRYVVDGGRTVHPGAAPSEYGASRTWWALWGRTVLLLGDVYFTDDAIDTVMQTADPEYRVFGRYGASRVTGTPYGEIFAVSWWRHHHELLDRHLALVHAARAAGTVTRPPGWMLLRSIQGTPLHRHRVVRPPFVDVDDATDDFDTPADYDRHPAVRR